MGGSCSLEMVSTVSLNIPQPNSDSIQSDVPKQSFTAIVYPAGVVISFGCCATGMFLK